MLSYFSISMDVDLSKNHYEHSSLKNVPVVKIPGSIPCMSHGLNKRFPYQRKWRRVANADIISNPPGAKIINYYDIVRQSHDIVRPKCLLS